MEVRATGNYVVFFFFFLTTVLWCKWKYADGAMQAGLLLRRLERRGR
jgi:hypothetical protein